MTATIAPPPSRVAPNPRRTGRRAITRWAWRLLRREWRQQLLVLSLLIVAVAAITVGLGVVVNVESSDQAVLGTAMTRIDIAGPGSNIDADLATARQTLGQVEAIEHVDVPVPGSVTPVDLRAQDPHGIFGAPMLRLVSGRYPSGATQVAVTAAVATTFGLHVGSVWPAAGRQYRVVGIVENPKNLSDSFALAAPGQISSPSRLTLLTDAGGSAATRFHPLGGSTVGIMTNGSSAAKRQRAQALAVLLLATIGLTFIGLLAVAGFTMMAQRRLRALGMIAAIGATDRQVRRVMLVNGAAVGLVGAGVGTVLGLVVWFALRAAFEHLVGHRIDPLQIPWWAVIAGAALAIVTAVAASWWPARSAARMSIVAALSGRPAPPRPAHRFALLGVALAGGGFVLLVLGHARHTVLIVSGILATTAGMLLLAPVGIRVLAAGIGRAPVAVRLALRDLARYQARSGAALAAASLAVGIAATIAVNASAQQAADHTLSSGNLPADQLVVWLAGNPNHQDGPASMVAAGAASGPDPAAVAGAQHAAEAIAQSLHVRGVLELDLPINPNVDVQAGQPAGSNYANLGYPITENGQKGYALATTPYVATPAVLAFYSVPAAGVGADSDILTSRADLSRAELISDGRATPHPVTIQHLGRLPAYSSAPTTLVTEKAMRAFGLTSQPAGWLVQSPQPLTAAQIRDAQHRAAASGVTVETRSAGDHSLQKLRDYATLTGLLVALGVLAMTVGLIRSESAGDLRTLTATGASRRTRRTLTAATAAGLALLAGIIGCAGAYLALIAWHWHDVDYLAHPPYLQLAVLIVGLPLAGLIGGWLVGRTPSGIARRPLD